MIILSKKLSPAPTKILIFKKSVKTVVPPVTEEKSPPASRITGALSPVIADSSTLAVPSIISPSLGISSPALTKTISPIFNSLELSISSLPSLFMRLALESFLLCLKVAAWALPLPSAILSAKFAKSKVINKIKVIKML